MFLSRIDRVQAISSRIERFMTVNDLSAIFVPDGQWKAGPSAAVVTPMITALQPAGFRDAVRSKVKWDGAGNNPDRVLRIMDELEVIYTHHEEVKAERRRKEMSQYC